MCLFHFYEINRSHLDYTRNIDSQSGIVYYGYCKNNLLIYLLIYLFICLVIYLFLLFFLFVCLFILIKSGDGGHRSHCPFHAKEMLYHLSYIPSHLVLCDNVSWYDCSYFYSFFLSLFVLFCFVFFFPFISIIHLVVHYVRLFSCNGNK